MKDFMSYRELTAVSTSANPDNLINNIINATYGITA